MQEKRRRMVLMQYEEGLPPGQIAKKLRVAVSQVYHNSDLVRRHVRKLVSNAVAPDSFLPQGHQSTLKKRLRRDDPLVRLAIGDYLQHEGIHGLTLRKLQSHIVKFTPGQKPLCQGIISRLLRDVYHLDYKNQDPAAFRYRDPYYDEKRLWVSRLLAQFHMDDVLLISIDESGFRGDASQGRRWQFHPKMRDVFLHVHKEVVL